MVILPGSLMKMMKQSRSSCGSLQLTMQGASWGGA